MHAAVSALPLVAADTLAVAGAVYGVLLPIQWLTGNQDLPLQTAGPMFVCSLLLVNLLTGLYPGVGLHPIVEFRQACLATTAVFVVGGVYLSAGMTSAWSVVALLLAGSVCLLLLPVLRSVTRQIAGRFRWWGHPVIIFGSGARAWEIYRTLQANPSMGLRPVGLVDDSFAYESTPVSAAEGAMSPKQASSTVRRNCVFWAIVAMPQRSHDKVRQVIEQVFLERYPHLLLVPDIGPLPSLWNRAYECGGMPGIRVEERLLMPVPRVVKRLMDLAVTIGGGLLASPLLLLICLLVKLGSRGPIFYGQRRIGRHGQTFQAWKFRTMVVNADQVLQQYLDADPVLREEWERDHKLKRDPRVTWIGWWLRVSSLDELPQLWNVLCGQMSLVGPRPIVDAEVEKYADSYRRYLKVVPGITGLWQISGRNNTTYQERVDLDSYYVRNWSPWLDLYILVRTVSVVLLRKGAY
jgi:Undecaprenyl-phosphate galactose phosphotransferase WbaP